MMSSTCQFIIEGFWDVTSAGAVAPGQVFLAIIAAIHGDAILHWANDGAEVAAYAILFDDTWYAVQWVAG